MQHKNIHYHTFSRNYTKYYYCGSTFRSLLLWLHFTCMQEMITMLLIEGLLLNNEQFCYFVN